MQRGFAVFMQRGFAVDDEPVSTSSETALEIVAESFNPLVET